jgi:DNA invertase Pin-like site-specific DNA recombinase
MKDARSGKFDVVAVWRFDRFARSTTHLIQALEEFKAWNIAFISLREQIDSTTAMGKAMFTITAAIAELEKNLILERINAGIQRSKEKGIHCGRPRRNFDIRAALALMNEGHGLKAMSRILDIPKTTLRTRLVEAGEWPRNEGSKTLPEEAAQ